jgi:hypothetical protein
MKLALSLPGFPGQVANNPAAKNFPEGTTNLAFVISKFAEVALYVGAFLMFFWAAWGVFDYIRAEGNKEALAKARKRIQWAIAGFVILLFAYFIGDVVQQILLAGANPGAKVLSPLSK